MFSGYIAFIYLALVSLPGCGGDKTPENNISLPYPNEEWSVFYQSRIDSSEFEWFTDVKSAASAFMNEMMFVPEGVSTMDIVIVGEGLFHATLEAELPSSIIVLTMERPYKHLGEKSIWQVVKIEKREWPKKESG